MDIAHVIIIFELNISKEKDIVFVSSLLQTQCPFNASALCSI